MRVLDTQVAEDNQVQPAPELPDNLQLLFAETCALERLNDKARTKLRLLIKRHNAQDARRSGSKVTTGTPSKEQRKKGRVTYVCGCVAIIALESGCARTSAQRSRCL